MRLIGLKIGHMDPSIQKVLKPGWYPFGDYPEPQEDGYLKTLKLRKFYERQTLQVKDIYRGFTTATSSMRKFLYRIGLNRAFLRDVEQRTLGYQLNDDEAPRRQWYKFRKDVFIQLRREHGI